jgi:shikimate dehydrogenase
VTGARVVVNATPVGMAGPHSDDPVPWPASLICPTMLVVDLVYNPPMTPLLQLARAVGAKTLNGLPMLVYQGAAAFRLWTGREAPVGLMRRAAEEALGV